MSAAVEAAAGWAVPLVHGEAGLRTAGHDRNESGFRGGAGRRPRVGVLPEVRADPRYGLDPMREIDYSCYAGASAFVSTASDLVRFAMAVNGHPRQGSGGQAGTFLQPATVQLLQTSQRLPSGEETGYGLGWDLETIEFGGAQTTTVGHDENSAAWWLPS